ncbi:MAG: hypothetical protein AAF901_12685, partial [Bacteroidota bacterium]
MDGLEPIGSNLGPRWFSSFLTLASKYEGYLEGGGRTIKGSMYMVAGTGLVIAGAAGEFTIIGAPAGTVAIVGGSGMFVHGSMETSYGLAQLKDAFYASNDPQIAAAANGYQYIGNRMDEKFGTDYIGDVGYYSGELIDLAAGSMKAVKTIADGGTSIYKKGKIFLAYTKLYGAPAEAANIAIRATRDFLMVAPELRLSRLTSLQAKVEFLEKVINVELIYTDEEYNEYQQTLTIENQIGDDEVTQE